MATARKENGEFCVTVGPVTRTDGMLTWLKVLVTMTELAIRTTCMLA